MCECVLDNVLRGGGKYFNCERPVNAPGPKDSMLLEERSLLGGESVLTWDHHALKNCYRESSCESSENVLSGMCLIAF